MLALLKKYIHTTSSILRKIFIVIAIYTIVVTLFIHFMDRSATKNYEDPLTQNRNQLYSIINDPKIKTTSKGQLKIALLRTASCTLMGEGCTDVPTDGNHNFSRSAIGFMSNLISAPLNNPPASGLYWASSGLEKAGFIPKTFATEGIGYAALAPLKSIWLLFRDLVFLLMVLVVVGIGFMIMFRAKLNPQTVISLENALPKIVMALIFITFSYAIAGFLIDMMYIVMALIIGLFGAQKTIGVPTKDLMDTYVYNPDPSVFNVFTGVDIGAITKDLSFNLYGLLPWSIQAVVNSLGAAIGYRMILFFVGSVAGIAGITPDKNIGKTFNIMGELSKLAGERLGPFAKAIKPLSFIGEKIQGSGTLGASFIAGLLLVAVDIIVGQVLGWIVPVAIVFLLLVFTFIYMYFKLFFMFLFTYINTLLLIIFAPLILAMEAIPGKSTFSSWVKNIILNLMTFPIVLTLFLLIRTLLYTPVGGTSPNLWQPPFLLAINPVMFKGVVAGAIFYMIPDLVKLIRQLTGVKPLPIDLNMGTFFSGAGAGAGTAFGVVGQYSTMVLAANNIPMLASGLRGLPGFKEAYKKNIPKPPEPVASGAKTDLLVESGGGI
ncbi:MAG: hypothetical protein Q7S61_06085 [bacterium]|nr:hypothetical protein [bacterium]